MKASHKELFCIILNKTKRQGWWFQGSVFILWILFDILMFQESLQLWLVSPFLSFFSGKGRSSVSCINAWKGWRVFFDVTRYLDQGGRSERRTHGGNKCKHTRARGVTRDNLTKNSLWTDAHVKWFLDFVRFFITLQLTHKILVFYSQKIWTFHRNWNILMRSDWGPHFM